MFLGFPTLVEDPFGDVPDPRFLYPSAQHAAVRDRLESPSLLSGAFVALAGGAGSGKSMLIESLLLHLLERAAGAAYVRITEDSSPLAALRAVLSDLGFLSHARGWPQLLRGMNDHLAQHRAAGGSVVLIADDVQDLSAQAQEEIRLLMGMEICCEPALSVVLAGRAAYGEQNCTTPDGQAIVRRPLLFRLDELARVETEAYVRHRLAVAGDGSCRSFHPDAFDLVHEHTAGIPGRINSLCSTAMLCAYADGLDCVCLDTLGSAIEVWQQSAASEPEPSRPPAAQPPCARCPELEQKLLDRERAIGALRRELGSGVPSNGHDRNGADETAARAANGAGRNGAGEEHARLAMEVAALSEAVTSLKKQLDRATSERERLREQLEQAKSEKAPLAARQPPPGADPAPPPTQPPAEEQGVRAEQAQPPVPEPRADQLEGGMLVALDGEYAGRKHPIRARRMSLGSAPDNDVQIKSGFASTRHAQLVWAAGACVLHDLDSTNGTFVNTRRIRRHVLRDGDLIRIGRRHFEYVEREAPGRPAASAAREASIELTR